MFRLTVALSLLACFATSAEAGRRHRSGYSAVNYSAARWATPTGYGQSVSYSATTVAGDPLADVNAQRARRGLRPYLRDEGLTQGALACATYRARNRIAGHVSGGMGDFQFLPPGAHATTGGCAAWPRSMPFGACGLFDGHKFAGAATVIGADGLAYHQIFYR